MEGSHTEGGKGHIIFCGIMEGLHTEGGKGHIIFYGIMEGSCTKEEKNTIFCGIMIQRRKRSHYILWDHGGFTYKGGKEGHTIFCGIMEGSCTEEGEKEGHTSLSFVGS